MTTVSAILIAGPTASGKSGLALRLAERLGGGLINADSMQVYRDLAILTARPTPQQALRAPHLLFGHVDGECNYSVGRFVEDAAVAVDRLRRDGVLPILVGGTGLYFKALTQGLSDIPHVPKALRADLRARCERLPLSEVRAELAARDPEAAAKLNDPQRILRALEVHVATGRSLASFQASKRQPVLEARSCAAIFLAPDRAALRTAIDRRFDAMLESGALDEVAALRARALDPGLPVMRALGVPPLLRYLSSEIDFDTAAGLVKRDTRAYAKRQFTFARNQLPSFRWVTPDSAEAAVMDAIG